MDLQFTKIHRRDREEVLSYFSECNQNTLIEACLIKDVGGTPSFSEHFGEQTSYDLAQTSTLNTKKVPPTRKSLSATKQKNVQIQRNIENIENIEITARSASKVLSIVEYKRKEDAIARSKAALDAREEQERVAFEAQLQAQRQAQELKSNKEQLQLLKEQEAFAAEHKQRKELQQQRLAQRLSLRDEQIKAVELLKKEAEAEHKKKIAEISACVKAVDQYFTQFSDVFHKIHHEFQSNQTLLSPLAVEVKPLNISMHSLIQRMKTEDVNKNDVEAAKNLCSKINLIYANILEEVAKAKKQAEEKELLKKQELEAQAQFKQNQAQPQDVTAFSVQVVKDSGSGDELSDCVARESLQWYRQLKILKQNNEKLFEQLIKDDSFKKYRFDCQKAVNIPVNAISPVNASHLRDKLQKLSHLLSGHPVVVGDGARVSAAQHPAGIPFCKDLLAKKFVKQGASTVSSKPEAAFAIAAVVVSLWQEFPDWGQLLLAHFHHECPYLVPVFWPQLEGQSNKDYYLSLGYTYNEDGEVEKQDKFLKRMSGIMRLYAAILITRLPRDKQTLPHPHDLGNGWRWLTALLNLEPRPDICASLLYDFLEVTGSSLLEQYGRQYRKLLVIICKGYFPRLQKIAISSSGPIVRLETFLQTILKQGSKPPVGLLPTNFW
ncbi:nucleoporin GLE1 [Thrips palmi]|uniref:mRNA export factor GLE1 n=1 Tax=Thrips palmi TaxID=161013 RepID=A0A6P8YQ29_THRPL|nr:nucleoporin GLE1 [Thrips palmi]XP_034239371.1 nucleoporin GLE1 [Thrips palmi]